MQKFLANAAMRFNRAAGFVAKKFNDIRKIQPAKIIFKIAIALCVTTAAGLFIASLTAACIATKLSRSEQRQNQQNRSTHKVLLSQKQINSPKCDLAECPAQAERISPKSDDSQILAALTQKLYPEQKQTWQSWITSQLVFEPSAETTAPKVDAILSKTKPAISSEFAIALVCWQALKQTTELLNAVKASEMKKIAAELAIPKYRNMNKTQLLIEIVAAHKSALAFSQ